MNEYNEESTIITVVYKTVLDEKDAHKLAYSVLYNKLAACANVITKGESFYWYKGEICKNVEYYVLFKTLPSMTFLLQEWIEQHHPYETPCIISSDVCTSKKFYLYIKSNIKNTN